MALAIFDLDNTLLGGDSDHAWGDFLVKNKFVDPLSYRESNDRFYQQYQNGSLNIDEYLKFSLEPLINKPLPILKEWHCQFMESHIKPMRLKKTDALLNKHREQGDYLLIITATNLFVTEPIAVALGVDDILATIPEIENNLYTGQIKGKPCFQEGKVSRLDDWLKTNNHSLEGSYFYSDSHNDLPLLKRVDIPVAVDPDETLMAYAIEHNWQVMSLRE